MNLPEVESALRAMSLREVILLTKRLPRKQLHVFFLRGRYGMTFKEISNGLGCPYHTAKANYRHAITSLKAEIVARSSVDNKETNNEVNG